MFCIDIVFDYIDFVVVGNVTSRGLKAGAFGAEVFSVFQSQDG